MARDRVGAYWCIWGRRQVLGFIKVPQFLQFHVDGAITHGCYAFHEAR